MFLVFPVRVNWSSHSTVGIINITQIWASEFIHNWMRPVEIELGNIFVSRWFRLVPRPAAANPPPRLFCRRGARTTFPHQNCQVYGLGLTALTQQWNFQISLLLLTSLCRSILGAFVLMVFICIMISRCRACFPICCRSGEGDRWIRWRVIICEQCYEKLTW